MTRKIVFALTIAALVSVAHAQGAWQKMEMKDKWGEPSSYTYMQTATGTGTSKVYTGNEPWKIGIQWDAGKDTIFMSIRVEAYEQLSAPVALFLDQKVKIALKDETGKITEYSAMADTKRSNTAHTLLIYKGKPLIEALRKDVTYTMLITADVTADNWSAKWKIVGGLPEK